MFGYKVAILLSATILLPAAIGVVYFGRLAREYKLIAALILIGTAVELLMLVLPFVGINNLLGLHFFAVAEILLLNAFYRSMARTPVERRVILWATIGLTIFSLVYSFVGKNITDFNSVPRAIESGYFTLLSCYLFYELTIEPQPVSGSIYFINGAVLFYFSSCFIVFAFSRYLATDSGKLLLLYNFHSIVNAITNLSYSVGLWIASRSSYSAS